MIGALPAVAWRLVGRRQFDHRLAVVLMFIGVVVASFSTFGGFAALNAAEVQRDRIASLRLSYGDSDGSSARGLDGDRLSSRRWNGREVERVLIAEGDSSGLRVPGLARLPRENEAFVSPALANLVRHDPAIASLMSRYQIAGNISPEGLVEPNELRAVIGARYSLPSLRPIRAVGLPEVTDPNRALNFGLPLLTAIMVGVPTLALISVCTRLGNRQKGERLQSLRLLGLSQRQVRYLSVIGALAIALPAVVAAWILFLTARSTVTRIPGTQFGFFGGDLQVGGLQALIGGQLWSCSQSVWLPWRHQALVSVHWALIAGVQDWVSSY